MSGLAVILKAVNEDGPQTVTKILAVILISRAPDALGVHVKCMFVHMVQNKLRPCPGSAADSLPGWHLLERE